MPQQTGNAGWTDASLKPRTTLDDPTLGDDDYNAHMAVHEPLFKWIIRNIKEPKELTDHYFDQPEPILVMGIKAMPLANELDLWGYPVYYTVRNRNQMSAAKHNFDVHGGDKVNVHQWDYYIGVPRFPVIAWIEDWETVPAEQRLPYLKYLKSRCKLLVAAIKNNREARKIAKTLNAKISTVYGKYLLLLISQ